MIHSQAKPETTTTPHCESIINCLCDSIIWYLRLILHIHCTDFVSNDVVRSCQNPSTELVFLWSPLQVNSQDHSGALQACIRGPPNDWRVATQNRKTEANLAENGRGRSAPAQFWPDDSKAAGFLGKIGQATTRGGGHVFLTRCGEGDYYLDFWECCASIVRLLTNGWCTDCSRSYNTRETQVEILVDFCQYLHSVVIINWQSRARMQEINHIRTTNNWFFSLP